MTRLWSMVVFSLLMCASESAAKFAPMPLAKLAGADVIAVGTIIRLSADAYTLRVTKWVAGEGPRKLKIQRFVDWQDASRQKPYEMNQRLMVFLERGSGGSYRALGGACEGEVFLENGKAVLRFPLVDRMTEANLIEAIPELRKTRLERGDRDYAAKARRLLESRKRLVRAATLEMLIRDAAKWREPGVEAQFGELLLFALVHPEVDVRVTAASWLGLRLSLQGAGQLVLGRLEELAASGPAKARPAAALAAALIEPDDVRRHAALLRAVADPAVPLDDRRAVAAEMIHVARPRRSVGLGVPVLGSGNEKTAARPAMADLRKPAVEALSAIQDEEVAIGVLAYLAAMFDIPDPVPANVGPLKRAWAELFAAATKRD